MRRLIMLLLIVTVVACAPQPIVPTADTTPTRETPDDVAYLNHNSELALGGCSLIQYTNQGDNQEFIWQCIPEGYSLYEDIRDGTPIRMVHTGGVYSVLPNGARGSIGLSFPVQLLPGCYKVSVDGQASMWGEPRDYTLQAIWTLADVDGTITMGIHNLDAPGDYIARFYLDAPQLGDYTISVFLHLQFASATADSYLTFRTITVEEVSAGHCN